LSNAASLGEMLQDRQDLIVWEFRVEQRGVLELGEPGLTSVTIE
jgi:hypothetical protein